MASVSQAAKLEARNQKPEKTSGGHSRRASPLGFYFLVSGFWFLVSLLGCVHLPKTGSEDPPPHGAVCQVVATWNHQVLFAADPVHGGAPNPGLAGRLYLFGSEISYPLIEEGSLIVDLYDDTKPATNNPPLPLEEWRLDPATLKRLVKKDMIGYGYTLFLPWGTYRPEINQVHLKVHFVTAKGGSLYADSGPVSLDKMIPASSHPVQTTAVHPPLSPPGECPRAPGRGEGALVGLAGTNAPAGPPAAVR